MTKWCKSDSREWWWRESCRLRVNKRAVPIQSRWALSLSPLRFIPLVMRCVVTMLIQVRLRGCGGVRSRRRHPQRESPLVILVVVERDPASVSRPSFGIRGIDRRCGHFRVEKVRTNTLSWSRGTPPSPFADDDPCHHRPIASLLCAQVVASVCFAVTNGVIPSKRNAPFSPRKRSCAPNAD